MRGILAEIRPDERRVTYAALLVLFGIMAGHALLETARDALFLAKLPPARLAWVYLSIAAVSLGIFMFEQRRGQVRQTRTGLSAWLCASAVITLAFWWLVNRQGAWTLYALYTWSGVLASLVVVRFWTALGDLVTVRQAKRLFALIGVGSVLGAIFGSGLARVLASNLDPRHIILAAAVMLLVTALGPVVLLPRAEEPAGGRRDRSMGQPSRQTHDTRQTHHPHQAGRTGQGAPGWEFLRPVLSVWEHTYLRRVAGLILLSTIAFTLVDFLFKSSVAENVPAERLGSFFASTYVVFNTLSLFAQLFLVTRMVHALGIDRVLSLLPALMVLGAAAVAAGGGLIATFVLKAFDGTLRHSLHRTATEVLFVPLTGELRSRAKGLIDVVGQRGGQTLASIAILALAAFSWNPVVLGLGVLALAIAWIRLAVRLKSDYLDIFRQTVAEGSVQPRLDFPELDLASLETLLSALNSANDAEVVAALDLLAEQGRTHVIPALILYHPSSRVVIRALELFVKAGRDDFIPITDRLLEHSDPEVRAATLRTRAWVAPSAELYQRFVSDPSPMVRVTSLVGLASYGGGTIATGEAMESTETSGTNSAEPGASAGAGAGAADGDPLQAMAELARTGTPEERLALARAIRFSPGAGYEDLLLVLADAPSTAVRIAVARAMREILSPRFTRKLIQMLPDRQLRNTARTTLVAIGAAALEELENTLGKPWGHRGIRRQLPRAISAFSPGDAAPILLRHLRQEQDGAVRYQILRALGRLRAADSELPMDTEVIEGAADGTLSNVYELMNWKLLLEENAREDRRRATPVHGLIVDLLDHKEILATERLFRFIGLICPEEDLRSLYRGMRSASRQMRSSSLELLEHLVRPPLRDPLLAVLDNLPPRQKLARAGPYHMPFGGDYEALLRKLLERGGVGMRALVAHHIGELRLNGLRDALEALPSDLDGTVARAVDRALALLDAPDGPAEPHAQRPDAHMGE